MKQATKIITWAFATLQGCADEPGHIDTRLIPTAVNPVPELREAAQSAVDAWNEHYPGSFIIAEYGMPLDVGVCFDADWCACGRTKNNGELVAWLRVSAECGDPSGSIAHEFCHILARTNRHSSEPGVCGYSDQAGPKVSAGDLRWVEENQ